MCTKKAKQNDQEIQRRLEMQSKNCKAKSYQEKDHHSEEMCKNKKEKREKERRWKNSTISQCELHKSEDRAQTWDFLIHMYFLSIPHLIIFNPYYNLNGKTSRLERG